MKNNPLAYIYYTLITSALALRYRIKESGIQKVKESEDFNPKRGILFLANHPAEVDPIILLKIFWLRFKIHPVAMERLFYIPVVRYFLNFVGALPVPDFDLSTNSYKKKKIEKIYEKLFSLLEKGENVLIYPAGGLKSSAFEEVGAASGVHHILQTMADVNVVLVRTTGLWGSSFSRAQLGCSPDLIPTFLQGARVLLKNGIFFAPRRKVTVECILAPKDFPRKGSKLELNRYLENWFNERGREPLQLVSYSFWKDDLPKIVMPKREERLSLEKVPTDIQKRVYEEISLLSGKKEEQLQPELDLAKDLGFDSLDMAQIHMLLKEQFGVANVPAHDLTTIGSVMIYAARLKETGDEEIVLQGKWKEERERPAVALPKGESVIEAFLENAHRMGAAIACADQASGQLSYKQFKRAVIALAFKIRELKGDKIGIMLPASVAVNIVIFATLLAGKVPVMINWTLGQKNLAFIVEQTGVQSTITSWNFLDRLENVELGGVEESFELIEEIKRSITLIDKLKTLFALFLPTKALLRLISPRTFSSEDQAVILFTSGTESVPKGVPLSNRNILSNLQGVYQSVAIENQDVLLAMLPPFHSFGFTITGILPLVAGMRVVFSPNPTDSRRISSLIENWGVTICCSAPTFLKGILRVAKAEQLQTLRLVVAGAEKTAQELFDKMYSLNPKAKLLEGYGITECSPILTLNPAVGRSQGVGLPFPQVVLLVVHPESYTPLPQGEMGLLLAKGPNIFAGYLDKKIRSPFVTVLGEQWYDTGDLCIMDEEGYVTLVGRMKRFVKIGGEMVSLGAIEEVIYEAAHRLKWPLDPDRPSLAVSATEEAGEKTKIHLFVTFEVDKNIVNEELKKSGMSNLIKISGVQKIAALPLLGSGKINYRALKTRDS